MPATYEPIATTTTSTNQTSVTLSSIPSTYTDLVLIVSNIRPTGSGMNFRLWVNGDTNFNFAYANMWGNGASVGSQFFTNQTLNLNYGNQTLSTSVPTIAIVNFFSYASTSMNKTFLSTFANDQNGAGTHTTQVNMWNNTAAINSITAYGNGADLAAGLVLSLYGILRA